MDSGERSGELPELKSSNGSLLVALDKNNLVYYSDGKRKGEGKL